MIITYDPNSTYEHTGDSLIITPKCAPPITILEAIDQVVSYGYNIDFYYHDITKGTGFKIYTYLPGRSVAQTNKICLPEEKHFLPSIIINTLAEFKVAIKKHNDGRTDDKPVEINRLCILRRKLARIILSNNSTTEDQMYATRGLSECDEQLKQLLLL